MLNLLDKGRVGLQEILNSLATLNKTDHNIGRFECA